MDRINYNIRRVALPLSEPIKYGEKDSVPLDQSAVQSFNIDPVTGRPLYDLTCILRAQSKAEQSKALEMMTKFDSDFLPEDISNEDALKYGVPNSCQLPSEMAELTEKFVEQRFQEWKAKKQIEDEEQARKEYDEMLDAFKHRKEVEKKESEKKETKVD